MNTNDPMAIKNTTGVPRSVVNEPIASYSAAAAEQGVRINDPTTNPITPGRVNQSQNSQNTQGFNAGYESVGEQARMLKNVFGMNVKSLLQFGEGIDPMNGNHVNGKVTRDVAMDDGSVRTEYIARGMNLSFVC